MLPTMVEWHWMLFNFSWRGGGSRVQVTLQPTSSIFSLVHLSATWEAVYQALFTFSWYESTLNIIDPSTSTNFAPDLYTTKQRNQKGDQRSMRAVEVISGHMV